MLYEVEVPITGYSVYRVEADSKEAAIEAVLAGEADSERYGETEEDIDSHNWFVCEV